MPLCNFHPVKKVEAARGNLLQDFFEAIDNSYQLLKAKTN